MQCLSANIYVYIQLFHIHYMEQVPTYYQNVMRTQGLDPHAFPDPLLSRTFGASMGGQGFAKLAASDDALVASSGPGNQLVLEVVLQTVEACPDQAAFLQALAATVASEAARGSLLSKRAAHNAVWEELWSRSHVNISISGLVSQNEPVHLATHLHNTYYRD